MLFWLSEGKADSEVAIILGSARRTVEKHVEHILGKLHAENRAAAIRTELKAMGDPRGWTWRAVSQALPGLSVEARLLPDAGGRDPK